MTAEEIQRLRLDAEAARAAAKVAADEALTDPSTPAKKLAAEEAAKLSADAEFALAAALAASTTAPMVPRDSLGTNQMEHAPWWHYVSIGSGMFVLLLLVSLVSRCDFERRAEDLTSAYKLAPSTTEQDGGTNGGVGDQSHRIVTACQGATPAERGTFILRQRSKLVELGDGHRKAAIEFGSYLFANINTQAVFGFIALISLLLITKRGITNAHGTLVAVFLLSSGIGLVYQGMFGVFQQKGNIDSNHAQAVEYGHLVDEIDSYCATGKLAISDPRIVLSSLAAPISPSQPDATKNLTNNEGPKEQQQRQSVKSFFVPIGADEFILYVEWRAEELRKFSISLDEKHVQSFTDPTRATGL